MTEKTRQTLRIGFINGIVIEKAVRTREAPSILAASRISCEIDFAPAYISSI
ncbi:hypothetical protein D3C77_813710 [compost metagenome]